MCRRIRRTEDTEADLNNVVKFRRPKPEKQAKPNGGQQRGGNNSARGEQKMHMAVWLPWAGLLVMALAVYLLRGVIG